MKKYFKIFPAAMILIFAFTPAFALMETLSAKQMEEIEKKANKATKTIASIAKNNNKKQKKSKESTQPGEPLPGSVISFGQNIDLLKLGTEPVFFYLEAPAGKKIIITNDTIEYIADDSLYSGPVIYEYNYRYNITAESDSKIKITVTPVKKDLKDYPKVTRFDQFQEAWFKVQNYGDNISIYTSTNGWGSMDMLRSSSSDKLGELK